MRIWKYSEDYRLEYEEAIKNGFDVLLFNYDDFLWSKKLKLNKSIEFDCVEKVLYRGWMMKYEDYSALYNSLSKLNLQLINTPDEYRNCHEFYYSYNKIKEHTPRSIFYPQGTSIDWDYIKNSFERFLVKDYVKSVKGFNFPSYFDNSYENSQLDSFIKQFIDIRGDLYTGGIAIKEYVDLDKTDNIPHEFRAFYYNKELLIIYQNSENYDDNLPLDFACNIPILNSNFYTVDFAILENGEIVIIETGDGQVSGISNESKISDFYSCLKISLNKN